MPLETASTINQLVPTNPVATDPLAQADEHLRLIKTTLQNTFPSVTGAINATHTEINTATDGSTAATSTTIADADRVVLNDNGTMVQAAMTDVQTYVNSNMTLRDDVVTTASIADNAVVTASIADNSVTASKLASGAAFAAGMVMPTAATSAPSGWLLAYGQAISRSTYSDLFTAIGTTYGTGDGSSTFNVPDLRGRVVAGQDDMGGSSANRMTTPNGDTLGATGGAETHTLTEAQLAAHDHAITGTYRRDEGSSPGGNFPHGSARGTNIDISGFLDITASNAGSGEAHNNVQPTIILNYIIKT